MEQSRDNQASNWNWLPLKVDSEPAIAQTLEIEKYNDKNRECLQRR